jgi:DNA replication protein DnaC
MIRFVSRTKSSDLCPIYCVARFPAPKSLDEFDFEARPSVQKPQILDLIRGDYLTRRENVLFVGPSGTGKTQPP